MSAPTTVALPQPSVLSTKLFASRAERTLVLSLCLVLTTVLAYLPVRKNAFINFDDPHYITANSHVKAGLEWDTVKWAFTTFETANWHPLTWLSHALDCQIFALNAGSHHFVNVLLHAINAVLLFLLLQSITGFTWRSLIVAVLFAVHPLNVESVAWAAERKNVLSMFFFLLALSAYVRYTRKPLLGRYLAVFGLFALALMAKPQVITFPFVLLLLDYWPLARMQSVPVSRGDEEGLQFSSPLRLVIEKVPLLLLSTISALVTLKAQHAGHAVRTIAEYSFSARVGNAIVSYVRYLAYAFFPWHLAPIYPHPGNSLPIWKLMSCAVILLAVTAFVIRYRRHGYLLFGWLWLSGTLVPMIGLVQVGEQSMADRYMYISMIGIIVMIVWAIADAFYEGLRRTSHQSVAFAVAAAVTVMALSIVTYHQTEYWVNSEALWNYTLRVTDRNYMAEDNLAQELATQGRVKEALLHFHAAEALHTYDPRQIVALGVYEQRNGQTSDAIQQYAKALQGTGDPALRAVAFTDAGSAYLELKDDSRAEQCFQNALRLDPNAIPAWLGSGVVANRTGNLDLAIRYYKKAASIKPNELTYVLLGHALEQRGRIREANAAYHNAKQLSENLQPTRSQVEHLLAR
jgi:protein O-mannosyl-transferase